MELQSLKNYKSAFNFIRNFILVLLPCLFLFFSFLIYLLFTKVNKGYESIWVINPKTGVMTAASQEVGEKPQEREAEYHNLVHQFLTHWYAFDQFTYDKNTTTALNWIGNSGKVLLNDYKSADVYRRMQEKNMVLTIDIDSININMNTVPATGSFLLHQTVSTPAGKLVRVVEGKFNVLDLKERTLLNPHKALIEDFVPKYVKPEPTENETNQ